MKNRPERFCRKNQKDWVWGGRQREELIPLGFLSLKLGGFTAMGRPAQDHVWGVWSGFCFVHRKCFIPMAYPGHHKSSEGGWIERLKIKFAT